MSITHEGRTTLPHYYCAEHGYTDGPCACLRRAFASLPVEPEDEVVALRAEIVRLRDALQKINDPSAWRTDSGPGYCDWCGAPTAFEDHYDTCPATVASAAMKLNLAIQPGPCPIPVVTLEDTVTCWGCGKELPEAEARPYWLRTKRSGWEWERQEYCEPCTHNLPDDAQPELDW